MAAKDELGRAGEARAAQHLEENGYTVVDRNWRCPDGEIDLVALIGDEVVVVEVKTRRGDRFGHPLEAIDARKRTRLWRLGVAWVAAHRAVVQGRRLRFAAVAITGADPATGRLELLPDLDVR